MTRKFSILAVGAVLLFGVAGCGGSDVDSVTCDDFKSMSSDEQMDTAKDLLKERDLDTNQEELAMAAIMAQCLTAEGDEKLLDLPAFKE